jgi:hypothetical protein
MSQGPLVAAIVMGGLLAVTVAFYFSKVGERWDPARLQERTVQVE